MNMKQIISAFMLIMGGCLLCALAACEQPVGDDGSSGGGGSDTPPANATPEEPPATEDPGIQQPQIVYTEQTAYNEDQLALYLQEPTVKKITINFTNTPVYIKTDTVAAARNEATELTIKAPVDGQIKTIIGNPGQTFQTHGNRLVVDGNVKLENFAIEIDQAITSGMSIPTSSPLATIYNPFIVKGGGTLTLGTGSSLTFADDAMPQPGSGGGKLVIESGGAYIDNQDSITKIGELGIWKAGFSEVTIKTKTDGTVDGVLQMDGAYFTGTASPKLDLAATGVSKPLVLSKSGAAYKTTVNGPVNVNSNDSSWLETGDILAVNGGPLTLTEHFSMLANHTLQLISGTVDAANNNLTMANGSTLITAENSDIVVGGIMTLAATVARVTHDGRITVQAGGTMADAAVGGGQLWNDGNGGSGRRGSLKIMLGGTGTVNGTEFVGSSGVPIQTSDNTNITNTEEYIELGPASYRLNGTATLAGNFGIGAGYSLAILDKSELIVPSGMTLTLGYNAGAQKGVNVTLGGRSDDSTATASTITVQSGGKLIDERPFTNGGTEQYLWPVSGYTFGGPSGKPLITIAQGGIVETSGGTTVIGDGGGSSGKLKLTGGNFQVLSNSSYGNLALTGNATITSDLWLLQKLTLMNGADLTVDSGNNTLFVNCLNYESLPNHLIGTTGSQIILSSATSFLGWTGNPTAKSGETLVWHDISW